MPNFKATKTLKIQSVLQDFPKALMKSFNNKLSCNSCSCTVSCNKRFLVENHQNTFKHHKALELISTTNLTHFENVFEEQKHQFCGKGNQGILFGDIPLYELNNKHIKNLFHNIGHCLPSETTC